MKYSYSKDIKYSFQDSESKVREVLMNIGFGVDAFKAKLNLDYKNYKILGACNPSLAHDALNSENLIGILMPCNILIIENQDATTKIVFPIAKSLLEVTNNNNILELAKEVDKLLESAFNNII